MNGLVYRWVALVAIASSWAVRVAAAKRLAPDATPFHLDASQPINDALLRDIYDEQRKELEFRRNREYQIFTWAATVLLALIGGSLVTRSQDTVLSKLGTLGIVAAILAIFLYTIYVVYWLLHQRKALRANQRVLVQIALRRGWFKELNYDGSRPLLPEEWKELGNSDGGRVGGLGKMAISAALGLVAMLVVWVSSRL